MCAINTWVMPAAAVAAALGTYLGIGGFLDYEHNPGNDLAKKWTWHIYWPIILLTRPNLWTRK